MKKYTYFTALKAEHIKKKGTGTYILSAIIGSLFPVVAFISNIFRPNIPTKDFEFSYYLNFIHEASIPLTYFFLPLLIIITASRVTQLDHRNGGWQLMETQPITKFAIYFSKLTIVLSSVAITIASLLVSGVLFGWIITWIVKPHELALMHIPYVELIHWGVRIFLDSMYIVALQFAIAVLMPSFVWSIIIGFAMLMTGVIMKQVGYVYDWYPYHILSQLTDYKTGSDFGYWLVFRDYVSVVAAIGVMFIGYQWYSYKTARQAFFGKNKRWASLVLTILLCGGTMTYLLTPNIQKPYHKTVFAGEIESSFPINHLYVVHPLLGDTLATIPVVENRFHHEFQKIDFAEYYHVIFDRAFMRPVYLGPLDSIYMKAKVNERRQEVKSYGTRLPENQTGIAGPSWSMIDHYLQQNLFLDNPQRFAKEIHKEWRKKQKEQAQFKTADNYVPRPDFKTTQEKMSIIQFLNHWEAYLKKRSAMYPEESTNTPPEIANLENNISIEDESLLSHTPYVNYVVTQLTKADVEDIDATSKALRSIAALEESGFKHKLLFYQLKKSLQQASNNEERTKVIDGYLDALHNEYYAPMVRQTYALLQSLGKGEPAPAFSATTLDGENRSLRDLKGQMIVLDLWATWCGPCKAESPFFEKFAIKYKDEPIVFVALSLDQDKNKWEVEAKSKSPSVKQWHINALDEFVTHYNITFIPRFVLIDKEGNFINAYFPNPSDQTFEILLRKELGLGD